MTNSNLSTNIYWILKQLSGKPKEQLLSEAIQAKLDSSLSVYAEELDESYKYIAEKKSVYLLRSITKTLKEEN